MTTPIPSPLKVACIQNTATQDLDENMATSSALVREAAAAGADFITLPEHCSLMEPRRDVLHQHAVPLDEHPTLAKFQALAAEVGRWMLIGSLPSQSADGRIANCSVLLDDSGKVVTSYDKIHMFDVDLPTGERFRESDDFQPGAEARLVDTPWGAMGMTVCYDLRFPQLYRSLAQAGARFLTVPAAFTKVTGDAHWHVLLRARAIENGCFVIAPCQTGNHYGKRFTCGHSLIIDPWGEVLADGGDEVGVVMAEIDPARVDEVRAMIPSLGHDRSFNVTGSRTTRISAVS
ncbi:MAG: carbon-nitrogen hydrolase family protein [Alphaproteobacteria bacterium]